MSKSIHISTARHILNSGDPIDLHVWKSDGSILRTPKLYLPAIQFLRRLEERKDTFLRRVPQNPRLLHLQGQRPRSIPLIPR